MADVSRETLIFTVIFCCFALSSMTAKLCGALWKRFFRFVQLNYARGCCMRAAFLLWRHRCHSSAALRFSWAAFLALIQLVTAIGTRRKTRLLSRPVASRTAAVDYERGTRFVFCRKTLVRIDTNKRQAHDLCLLAIIAVSSVAVQVRCKCLV